MGERFLARVQAGPEVHLPSGKMDERNLGAKRPGSGVDHPTSSKSLRHRLGRDRNSNNRGSENRDWIGHARYSMNAHLSCPQHHMCLIQRSQKKLRETFKHHISLIFCRRRVGVGEVGGCPELSHLHPEGQDTLGSEASLPNTWITPQVRQAHVNQQP